MHPRGHLLAARSSWHDTGTLIVEYDVHEKMYKIATDKYNPFSVGGSESIHDFD